MKKMDKIFDILVTKFGSDLISLAEKNYLEEPRGRYQSNPMPIIKPKTTKQVSEIISFCNQNNIRVIPYAGGTGLVGGQTIKTNKDTILLSVERMQAIRDILPDENIIIVEAGAILENVRQAASNIDRLFPLALASQGSCRIGGNLATNAGGVQVVRYGNTRDLCLGIEAVLPDGSILNGLKRLRKDNTGYDLRNLLIGSEGTLGIITAACLKLFPKPKETVTGLFVISNPEIAIKTLAELQAKLDTSITAFELIHKQSYNFLSEVCPDVKIPFDKHPEWSILIELSGGMGSNLESRLFEGLEDLFKEGLVSDALIAQSEKQAKEFWDLRENIPEANRRIGSISNHDISLPISLIPKFIQEMPTYMAHLADLRINCFGHLGDGNLHYNVFPPLGKNKNDYVHLREEIKTIIHDKINEFGGSVSAEHGIGRLKIDDLEKYGDPVKLIAMRSIKNAIDPKGIMNPGAVLRERK
ncbi:FAD-binding oxidoreductase [Amylibacter sp.]|nr:FAD-binding oxidoreductase [Amylibacter sp.]MDB9716317.1 FAD-binding oxidoreductase [Amylibacter sp.]